MREKKKELHQCNTFWVLHEISIQIEPLSLILEHGSPSIKAKTPSKIRIATKHSPPYESRWKNFTNDLCSYIKSPFFFWAQHNVSTLGLTDLTYPWTTTWFLLFLTWSLYISENVYSCLQVVIVREECIKCLESSSIIRIF